MMDFGGVCRKCGGTVCYTVTEAQGYRSLSSLCHSCGRRLTVRRQSFGDWLFRLALRGLFYLICLILAVSVAWGVLTVLIGFHN